MRLLLKNLLFTFVFPGTVAGWGPYWVLTSRGRALPRLHGWPLVPGFLLAAFGLSIYAWCVWDFASVGRATPFPLDPPKHLVVRGLYRYTRNPMYVGVLSVILGWAAVFRSLAVAEYAVVAALGCHLFVLVVEEPSLRAKFGPAYSDYCKRVSRWFPRRPRQAT